jgi:hypothetical protein
LRLAAQSRRPGAATAAIVALAILFGGMPLTLGIVVVHSSEATFTLDICHPVQSFSPSPVTMAAIFPDSPAVAQLLPDRGRYAVSTMTLRARAADAPDPPPPKTRA